MYSNFFKLIFKHLIRRNNNNKHLIIKLKTKFLGFTLTQIQLKPKVTRLVQT